MDEKETAAADAPAPVVDTADEAAAPAEPSKPSPEPERVTKAEYQTEIARLNEQLRLTREEATEGSRRAQRAADTHASRLEKRIERQQALLDEVATRGMDESDVRAWRSQRELDREREKSASYDSEAQVRRAEEDFRAYSTQVLSEEAIDQQNPVFKEAWGRFSAQAKDPSDWKAALNRAVAEVRKDEVKKAREEAKTAEQRARDDERAKVRNEKRESAGTTSEGVVGSVGKKKIENMTEAEFDAYDKQREEERNRRRMAMIR